MHNIVTKFQIDRSRDTALAHTKIRFYKCKFLVLKVSKLTFGMEILNYRIMTFFILLHFKIS